MPRSKVYRPVQQAYRKHTKIYRPSYATPKLHPPPRRPTTAANTREEFEPSPKKSLGAPPPPG